MNSPSTEAGRGMLDEFEGATFVHEHILAIEKGAHAQLDITALTNAIHWSGMVLVDSVTGRPVDDAEQTVARYYIDGLNASESPPTVRERIEDWGDGMIAVIQESDLGGNASESDRRSATDE